MIAMARTATLLTLVLFCSNAGAAAGLRAQLPPSPAEVLGHELGERFTDHAGVVRYAEALAAASPRVELLTYGATPEGRPLLQLVIATPEHLERLEEILERNRRLTDPGTPAGSAREIGATNPAVVYFSYGVHGNEASSSEAALYTAWDLARGGAGVEGVLDHVVVVIDPAANPDGRDRYVNWYRQAAGVAPNPHPEAREHWEPWPGGRFNHYLFDLNRDWAWATQPETRARLATWERWSPQVHVDFHEMSWTSSYFFFPAATPINPQYPPYVLEWAEYFGEMNARAFDARGWAYWTAEDFDLFYPGYGDSWPSLVGAIGMTYEQAGHGRAGLAIRRPDGQILTLRDRAQHHRVAGNTTLAATAARKAELLEGFAGFHRTAGAGEGDVLLVPGRDAGRMAELVGLLQEQGIRVEEAGRAFRASARPHAGFDSRRDFPAGTYRVRARQPRGRLALTLLQAETVLDATYSYDVSAWSLPFAFGVEAHRSTGVPDAAWRTAPPLPRLAGAAATREWTGAAGSLTLPRIGGAPRPAPAEVDPLEPPPPLGGHELGYLIEPGLGAWVAMSRFLVAGGRAVVLDQAFAIEGRDWPAGTFYLPRRLNEELETLLRESGAAALASPVRSGFTTRGRDIGTERSYLLTLPRIGVVTGEGVSPTSYGAHWFFLERTLGLPFDALSIDRLGSLALDDYDVLVLPAMGASASRRVEDARERLERWIRAGGTLIAIGSGAEKVGESIGEIERTERPEVPEEERVERALRGREARELDRWEQSVPGTILPVRIDPAHPLSFGAGLAGADDRLFVLHATALAFQPSEELETVGYFPAELRQVSGVISAENLERLSLGSWLGVRRLDAGRLILFADDPLFRHFWYGTFQPYANALLIGPAL